jgi:hypothetical protein
MSIVTSQQLDHYYEQHKGTEGTFNKRVTLATGLLANKMYLINAFLTSLRKPHKDADDGKDRSDG